MKNKALLLLFNLNYNDGKLIKLITTKKKIKELDKYYKENFLMYDDYEIFLDRMGKLRDVLNLSNAAKAEFEKQFKKKQALQQAILNECFIVETLSRVMGLENFIDADEKVANVPTHLLESLIKAKGGELEAQFPRYIYYSEKAKTVLLQYGDSASIDAIFVNDGFRIRLEIKDQLAKLGEYDLEYLENGKIVASEKIKKEFPDFIQFIDKFNEETNVYEHLGSNYKFGLDMDRETAQKIINSTYQTKKIDIYLLQDSKSSKIFALPSYALLDNIDFSGSEIRTAGRNNYSVFTLENLQKTLEEKGAIINGNNVKMPYDSTNEVRGRGMTKITRYNINNIYFLKINDVNILSGYVFFDIEKVKQKKATISMHICTILNMSKLSQIYKELNK